MAIVKKQYRLQVLPKGLMLKFLQSDSHRTVNFNVPTE